MYDYRYWNRKNKCYFQMYYNISAINKTASSLATQWHAETDSLTCRDWLNNMPRLIQKHDRREWPNDMYDWLNNMPRLTQ